MAELLPFALSLHQRDAGLDARERVAVALAQLPPVRDRVVLSSCHRVEVYAVAPGDGATASDLEAPDELRAARRYAGREAVLHLFRVAAGLDSAIVGEGQIASQIRRTHTAIRETGLDPILDRLLQRAIALSRELRSSTALGAVTRSVGSIAVEEAVALLPSPRTATAVVVGAGEIGKLAARALASRVAAVVIVNRDLARAEEVAGRIGARALPLSALREAIDGADVCISAADSRGALMTRELLAPRGARRPLVVVDIAVPRSVAADARELPGITYRDVDQLNEARVALPPGTVAEAERRCAAEADAFMAELRGRSASPTIRMLREHAEAVRARQVARAMRKLSHLAPRDRRIVEGLAASLTGALVHSPTVALRHAPERQAAARELFGLNGSER